MGISRRELLAGLGGSLITLAGVKYGGGIMEKLFSNKPEIEVLNMEGIKSFVTMVKLKDKFILGFNGEEGYMISYSKDGEDFSKPFLSIPNPIDFGGIFIDPKDNQYPLKGLFSVDRKSLHIFYSKDGKKFSKLEESVLDFVCDSSNQVIYDNRLKKYVAYLRGFGKEGRKVVRVETSRLDRKWIEGKGKIINGHGGYIDKEARTVMKNKAGYDVYNPAVTQYSDNLYLAFPSLFEATYKLTESDGVCKPHMAYSKDGKNFFISEEPYIDLKDKGMLFLSQGIFPIKNNDYMYGILSEKTHMTDENAIKFGMKQGYEFVRIRHKHSGYSWC